RWTNSVHHLSRQFDSSLPWRRLPRSRDGRPTGGLSHKLTTVGSGNRRGDEDWTSVETISGECVDFIPAVHVIQLHLIEAPQHAPCHNRRPGHGRHVCP